MSLLGQIRTYSQLTDEQKRVIKTKYFEGERSPQDWLSFLGQIVTFDTNVDSSKRSLKIGCGVACVLFFGGIFLISVFGPVVLLLGLAAGVVLGILAYIQSRVDLPDSFRLFVIPLISVLREEMEQSDNLYLKIDLRGKTISDKEARKPRRSGSRGNERFFQDNWISGKASLVDGSRLDFRIVDFIRERKTSKRNARGKTKTKTKHKIKRLIEARLGLRQDSYLPVAQSKPKEHNETINIKSGDKRNIVRVRRMVVSSDPDALPELGQLLQAIGHCYSQVTLAKPADK